MDASVDNTIAGLRRVVSADSDAELARKLGVDKSTVSGWRARGRVPARFTSMLEAPSEGTLLDLRNISGELQERAYPIGNLRFVLLRQDIARSGDIDRALPLLRDMLPYWLVLHRAVHDLLKRVEMLQVDLETAQALLLQEDLRDPDATALRVERDLQEDMTDNPTLRSYK